MRAYAVALLVVYGLSSFSLASELHHRLRSIGRSVSVFTTYCGLLCLIAALGAATLGVSALFPDSASGWLVSLLVGAVAGEAVLRSDRFIVRSAQRRSIGRMPARSPRAPRPGRPRMVPTGYVAAGGPRRRIGTRRVDRTLRLDRESASVSVLTVATIAVLEEVIYRGFLLLLCLSLPGVAAAAAASGLVAAFALSHVWFGWAQVAAKLPLGGIATLCVLLIGGVVVAVVAHVVFNVRVAARMGLFAKRTITA